MEWVLFPGSPNQVLTSAHVVDASQVSSGKRVHIRTGSNINGQGGVEIAVSSILIHPEYQNIASGRDLAILTLAQPVPGGEVLEIGETLPPVGEVFTMLGFGREATTGGYVLPMPGDRMAARASRVEHTSSDRIKTEFWYTSGHPILLGNVTGGDSGGPLVAATGNVYGLSDNASTSPGPGGWALYENLTLPPVRTWITSNLQPAVGPPAPPELTGEKSAANAFLLKAKGERVQPGGEWKLETSTDLNIWTGRTEVTWTNGPGPEAEESSCVLPIDAGKAYFRLKWVPAGR